METLKHAAVVLLLSANALYRADSITTDSGTLLERCTEIGEQNTTYNSEILDAVDNMTTCFEQYVNLTELKSRAMDAIHNQSMDPQFKYYCRVYRRHPEMGQKCTGPFLDSVRKFSTSEEWKTIDIAIKSLAIAVNFICYNGGQRIDTFINGYNACVSAHGPIDFTECPDWNKEFLSDKWNDTALFPFSCTDGHFPIVSYNDEVCANWDAMQSCMVNEVKKCGPVLPGLLDVGFNATKEVTPCWKSTNDGEISSPSMTALSASLLAVFIVALTFK